MHSPNPNSDRRCGQCSECCFAYSIPEIRKPSHQDCPHRKRGAWKACSVYADRPQRCADFRCSWLDGHLTNAERPDRLGIVFTSTRFEDLDAHGVFAHETRSGAASEPRARELIERLATDDVVFLVTATQRYHVICRNSRLTPHLKEMFARAQRERDAARESTDASPAP